MRKENEIFGFMNENSVESKRKSYKWKRLRVKILERDNYRCILCGVDGRCSCCGTIKLHIDHIKSAKNFEELFFEPSNLRTLCYACHYKTDNFGRKVKLECACCPLHCPVYLSS